MKMSKNFKEKIFKWLKQGKADWKQTINKIRELNIEEKESWGQFLGKARRNLLNAYDFEQMLAQDTTLKSFTLKELQAKNKTFFSELLPGSEGYDVCFANPDFAVERFGKELGQVASATYTYFRGTLANVREANYSDLLATNNLFLKLFELWQAKKLNHDNLYSAFKHRVSDEIEMRTYFQFYSRYCPAYELYKELISRSDFSDPRYLYRYGIYVDSHTEKLARFLNDYPEDELGTIAQNQVKAYLRSFSHKNQDYRKKKYAKIHCPQGMEKLGFLIGEELKKAGLSPVFSAPPTKNGNEQYGYDHRFQQALYLDTTFSEQRIKLFEETLENIKESLKLLSGSVVVWLFGENPFVPDIKENAIQMSEEQDKIQHNMQNQLTSLLFATAPRNETSFSIISFPSTEIGANFEEIFKDTLELNNLDSNHYEKIQENMIEILDKASYVEVKGKEGNETNIQVQLPPLSDSDKETNFINCGADVNIPVGEIFTSPKLTGTNGVLHVADIFLFGLRYYNLKITFKDGMVTDYSCTNFNNPEDNQKYMFDNLFKPNKTLPIGEFAIGTNTLAYKMAQKHQIQHLLPILIVEKMGPHFAIGDTCFAHEEDSPQVGVISGKSMIATDNEKSILRKTDPANAYTHKHIDITLPYDMLAEITAVRPDNKRVPIILDGRFVVKGTEELNIPLDNM
jgi:hypothetical protein